MDLSRSRKAIVERIAREGRRPAEATILGSPVIRRLMGWMISLGVLALVANVPIKENRAGYSWRNTERIDTIELLPEPQEIIEREEVEGGLITKFDTEPEEEEEEPPEEEEPEEDEGEEIPDPESRIAKLDLIERGPIMEFVDQTPTIVGGLSTLYLNIEYPQAARDNGVQGLSVLVFVVEKDGSTTDIQVMKSLHPACDSAAVAAVRRTLFKPGRQNGEIVRVKMRLPIRFKLINHPTADTLAFRSGTR